MADELKAAGNKAIAEKNFDVAMYIPPVCFVDFLLNHGPATTQPTSLTFMRNDY
jgi:hypothetical protein